MMLTLRRGMGQSPTYTFPAGTYQPSQAQISQWLATSGPLPTFAPGTFVPTSPEYQEWIVRTGQFDPSGMAMEPGNPNFDQEAAVNEEASGPGTPNNITDPNQICVPSPGWNICYFTGPQGMNLALAAGESLSMQAGPPINGVQQGGLNLNPANQAEEVTPFTWNATSIAAANAATAAANARDAASQLAQSEANSAAAAAWNAQQQQAQTPSGTPGSTVAPLPGPTIALTPAPVQSSGAVPTAAQPTANLAPNIPIAQPASYATAPPGAQSATSTLAYDTNITPAQLQQLQQQLGSQQQANQPVNPASSSSFFSSLFPSAPTTSTPAASTGSDTMLGPIDVTSTEAWMQQNWMLLAAAAVGIYLVTRK